MNNKLRHVFILKYTIPTLVFKIIHGIFRHFNTIITNINTN